MESYEKKYKEALEKLQEALAPKDGREISGLARGCIEEIFPELKESEDEKIRKRIIHALHGDVLDMEETTNALAWLEKQEKETSWKPSKEEMDVMRLYNRVLNTFGVVNQTFMLVEECAELLNAVAKMKRGRAKKEDIITELADVSIMVEQMAFFYGWDDYKNEKERKLTRLEDRINRHTKKGGEE